MSGAFDLFARLPAEEDFHPLDRAIAGCLNDREVERLAGNENALGQAAAGTSLALAAPLDPGFDQIAAAERAARLSTGLMALLPGEEGRRKEERANRLAFKELAKLPAEKEQP